MGVFLHKTTLTSQQVTSSLKKVLGISRIGDRVVEGVSTNSESESVFQGYRSRVKRTHELLAAEGGAMKGAQVVLQTADRDLKLDFSLIMDCYRLPLYQRWRVDIYVTYVCILLLVRSLLRFLFLSCHWCGRQARAGMTKSGKKID